MKFSNLIILLLILVSCKNPKGESTGDTAAIGNYENPLYALMADSEMKRNPDPRLLDFRPQPKWEYTNGLICSSFLRVW